MFVVVLFVCVFVLLFFGLCSCCFLFVLLKKAQTKKRHKHNEHNLYLCVYVLVLFVRCVFIVCVVVSCFVMCVLCFRPCGVDVF